MNLIWGIKMATLQDEQKSLDRLNKTLGQLSVISPESLVRKEKLGDEINFEPGLPYFKRTLKLFKDLKNSSMDGIPYASLEELNNIGQQALSHFQQILGFTMQQNNPLNVRDQLIGQIRDSYDSFYKVITPHIAYSIRMGTDFEALESQARTTVNSMQEAYLRQNEALDNMRKESNEILDSMRTAAAEAGVSQHSIYFKLEAEEHAKTARYWLIANIIAGAAALALALYSVNFYITNLVTYSTAQSIQIGITKLIAFSILYFGLIWTSRNYRAHRHNAVINKHRQNALSTFQAFINATDDDSTKNAVLVRSTEAIFSPGVTGYLTKEPEPQGGAQILEVIRSAINKQPE
jgi:hypothetical protein